MNSYPPFRFRTRAAAPRLVLTLSVLALMGHSHAQSEASVAVSIGDLSEGTATVLGAAVGAGAGLVVGGVAILGSGAVLTIATTATTSSEAAEVTMSVPLEIAQQLQKRLGARVESVTTETGTRLQCDGVAIAFLPNPEATASSPRTAL